VSSPYFPFPQTVPPIVARTKRPRSVDGGPPPGQRFDGYGAISITNPVPTKHVLADEGSYFYATNPTIDTQVTYGILASFSDTSATFAINNSDSPTGKRIYMDFVRIAFTGAAPVIPASAIGAKMVVRLDSANRAPTAGNVSITPVNTNGDDPTGSIAKLSAFSGAAMTLPAVGTAVKTAARAWMRHAIPVTQDELICLFGSLEAGGGVVGTAAGRVVSACNPVVIGPQQWALFHIYFPSNATTAAAFEYDLGWWER